ncbi:MAG: hypothetical protein AAGH38_06145, partial [Pseudomonadota bacterium]
RGGACLSSNPVKAMTCTIYGVLVDVLVFVIRHHRLFKSALQSAAFARISVRSDWFSSMPLCLATERARTLT